MSKRLKKGLLYRGIAATLVIGMTVTLLPGNNYSVKYTMAEDNLSSLAVTAVNEGGASLTTELQQRCFDLLNLNTVLPDGAVLTTEKIDLPSSINDCFVEWSSNTKEVIDNDGTVKMPSTSVKVTLTAIINVSGKYVKKIFKVDVVPPAEQEKYFNNNFGIVNFLGDGMQLANSYGTAAVTWSGSEYVSESGLITSPADNVTAVITARFGNTSKDFNVTIYGKGSLGIEAYTRLPQDAKVYSGKLAYAMHLAYNNGSGYSVLNNNSGILYAAGIVSNTDKISPRNLKNPCIFTLKDGSYGVLAVRTNAEDESTPNFDDTKSKGSVILFTSDDLIHYKEAGLIKLTSDRYVSDVYCSFNTRDNKYIIRWTDNEGNNYTSSMNDITKTDEVSDSVESGIFNYEVHEINSDGACSKNTIYVPQNIGNKVIGKLTKLTNTVASVPERLYARTAEQVSNTKATLSYTDGSTATKSVKWDLAKVDFNNIGGSYTVTGDIAQTPYFPVTTNPLISTDESAQADPCIFYYKGEYYLTGTNEGNDTHGWEQDMYIRKSETIEGIQNAEKQCILYCKQYTDINNRIWAPEIHEVGGEIYIFFASDPAGTSWSPQSNVMHLKSGGDLMNPDDWEEPVRVKAKDGKLLNTTSAGGITLDMTTFNIGGTQYLAWAQRANGSCIYVATVDESDPSQLTSDTTLLCLPSYSWENNDNTPVDEGPFAIITDKKIFITYSASSTGTPYCVGLLSADINSDLLDASSWNKSNFPVVDSNSVEGECGVGHNSYTTDADGNLVFVYHARRRNNDIGRLPGLRTVQFDIDGDPVLYLTDDMELAPEYKTVTMNVIVGDKPTVTPMPITTSTAVPQTVTPIPPAVSKSADTAISATQITGELSVGDVKSVSGYLYKITGKETVAVTSIVKKTAKSIVIKASVVIGGKTYKVTEIADGAFKNLKKATSALIGKNVKKIGSKVFYRCIRLKNIRIKCSSIKYIGKNAFKGINGRTIIKVPAKMLPIYRRMLKNKGLSRNCIIKK